MLLAPPFFSFYIIVCDCAHAEQLIKTTPENRFTRPEFIMFDALADLCKYGSKIKEKDSF